MCDSKKRRSSPPFYRSQLKEGWPSSIYHGKSGSLLVLAPLNVIQSLSSRHAPGFGKDASHKVHRYWCAGRVSRQNWQCYNRRCSTVPYHPPPPILRWPRDLKRRILFTKLAGPPTPIHDLNHKIGMGYARSHTFFFFQSPVRTDIRKDTLKFRGFNQSSP